MRTIPDLATHRLQYVTYVNIGSGTQKAVRFNSPWGRRRAFHKLLQISVFCQKVAQKLLKESQKLLKKTISSFCCSLPLFSLMRKYANCTTKVRFLSIFVQFRSIVSVARCSSVNLGIFEAQHQTNCNNFFFKAMKVRVAYLAIY